MMTRQLRIFAITISLATGRATASSSGRTVLGDAKFHVLVPHSTGHSFEPASVGEVTDGYVTVDQLPGSPGL